MVQISSTLSQPSCGKVLPYGSMVHLYFTLEIKSLFKKYYFLRLFCATRTHKIPLPLYIWGKLANV